MKSGRLILALGLTTILAARASAGSVTIGDLYNTGVDASHNALTLGAADAHYSLTLPNNSVVGPIVVGPPRAGSWVDNVTGTSGNDAQWISPSTGTVDNGTYAYTSTKFTLGPGAILTSVLIEGRFTADDQITKVLLNGQDLALSSLPTTNQDYGHWFNFTIDGSTLPSGVAFQAGTNNTLTFVTANTAGWQTGLIVQMTGTYNTTASGPGDVPEPASLAMMGLGAGAALVFARRRAKAGA